MSYIADWSSGSRCAIFVRPHMSLDLWQASSLGYGSGRLLDGRRSVCPFLKGVCPVTDEPFSGSVLLATRSLRLHHKFVILCLTLQIGAQAPSAPSSFAPRCHSTHGRRTSLGYGSGRLLDGQRPVCPMLKAVCPVTDEASRGFVLSATRSLRLHHKFLISCLTLQIGARAPSAPHSSAPICDPTYGRRTSLNRGQSLIPCTLLCLHGVAFLVY